MKRKLKKYRVEIFILSIAVFITITSLIIYFQAIKNDNNKIVETNQFLQKETFIPIKIYVDISGSVNKPDLYEALEGTRLKELIKKAGGLSENADKEFFERNFNLARIVIDQEKIYIPSVWEVNNGYFIEEIKTVNIQQVANIQPLSDDNNNLININSASIEELESLPEVGKVTSQKIIDNRPFKALEELIDKKIVSKSVYEKIKNLVSIN